MKTARREIEGRPVLAVCYDFDKTLSPEDMQAQGYIQSIGYAGNGILEGYPDGNFGGDRMMTRYEFGAIVYRAMQRGFEVPARMLKEFEPELERFRVDTIAQNKAGQPTIERVRVIHNR